MESAINGTLTVKFNREPAVYPTANDFIISRTINGGTASAVAPTLTWNKDTHTATLAVPQVAQTSVAQNVAYSVKYKEFAAQTASFTVAAPNASTVKVDGAGYSVNAASNHIVRVYFSSPVDEATATNIANYRVAAVSGAGVEGNSIVPSSVTLGSAGSHGNGQVATLVFSPTNGLSDALQHRVYVNNVTAGGATIPNAIVSFTTATTVAADSVAPNAANPTFTTANGTTVTSVVKGTDVILSSALTDVTNNLISSQYRITNAAGTVVIGWTNLSALDGKFDSLGETATVKISTTDLAAGTYTIDVRSYDAAGNVSTTLGTANLGVTLPEGLDVTAPNVAITGTTNYAPVAVTGALAQGAKTVRVTGTATDTHTVGTLPAKVQSVEYRVRTVDVNTGNVTVANTWVPVTLNPGQAYGGASVSYSFVTPALTEGNVYVIDVRATDASGNVSTSVVATPATTGNFVTTTPTFAASVTAVTGNFQVVKDTTVPVVGATPTVAAPASGPNGLTAATATRLLPLEITGTITDNLAVAKVEYSVERVVNGAVQSVRPFSTSGTRLTSGSGTASAGYEVKTDLPSVSGEYRITVIAYDASGNASSPVVVTRFVDVTAPTATITANAATPNVKTDFVVTFSEVVTPAAVNFEVKNAAGVVIGTAAAASTANGTVGNSFVFTVAENLVQVGNTVTLTGIADAAGNSSSATYTFQASDVQ